VRWRPFRAPWSPGEAKSPLRQACLTFVSWESRTTVHPRKARVGRPTPKTSKIFRFLETIPRSGNARERASAETHRLTSGLCVAVIKRSVAPELWSGCPASLLLCAGASVESSCWLASGNVSPVAANASGSKSTVQSEGQESPDRQRGRFSSADEWSRRRRKVSRKT